MSYEPSFRARRITQAIQSHDYLLFAKSDKDNMSMIRVYRKGRKGVKYVLEGLSVLNVEDDDYLVMSLTDTWGIRGKPVEWGIDVVVNRIKALDLWNSDNLSNKVFKDEEKHQIAQERKNRNSIEAFLSDFKGQFAKATSDINTSNLSKNAYNKRSLTYGNR